MKAISNQNWGAVGLEFVIVILGIVIGFQVTLWGQERADRAKGEAYLIQMVSDLNETLALISDANSKARAVERSAGLLVSQFDTSSRPVEDSVYTWLGNVLIVEGPLPILSTAEALVSTGELNLIVDNEVRSAISAYLQKSRVNIEFQRKGSSIVFERLGSIMEVIDLRKGMARHSSDFRTDWENTVHPTLSKATLPSDPNGVGLNLPEDLSMVFKDRKAYSILTEIAYRQGDLASVRGRMLTDTRELLALIKAK